MNPATRVLAAAALILVHAGVVAAGSADIAAGERIYRHGVLPEGAALRAARRDGAAGEGAVIACVSCHRRSGLGSSEGTSRIPPITGKYLFATAGVPAGLPTQPSQLATPATRVAYDDASLAAAIRTGIGRGGRPLDYLMPRYEIDDTGMADLIAYIKSLPTVSSPGVSESTIDLATIVTPDADPVARDGMLAVLNRFIEDKNAFLRGGRRPLQTQGQVNFRVTRRWQLHVWTLKGGTDTWESQLQAHLRAEPAFAVLSGIGGQSWIPVHQFCEHARIPCVLPNVDIPVDAEQDFYPLYFSKGVLLEAELLANRLQIGDSPQSAGRILQIYEAGDAAEVAVRKLAALLAPARQSLSLPVKSGDVAALRRAVGEARPADAIVLWLRPHDLEALGAPPAAVNEIYLSGTLAGLEHAPLPPTWRDIVKLTYPIDLPEQRAMRVGYPLRWMQVRHIPIVAEKVQADTYLACGIVSEAISEMLDSFMRDYLLERIESMLSQRQLTGYYPRMGVATGQRFASKGGYFVHFTAATGTAVAADGDWLVP